MAKNDALINCADEELLLRFRDGEQEAFEVLLRRYERELYGYLRRYVGDAALAEDVFQNTFLQVYLKADSFEAGRRVKPWLYTVATHQAIDAMRRAARHQAVSLHSVPDDQEAPAGEVLASKLESTAMDPLEAVAGHEERLAVRAAVDALPQFLRQVVILGYYQGLRYQEIADVLGIPLGTVKSRLHTAIERLEKIWQANLARGKELAHQI